jgi:hypothetical protein
LGDSLFSTKIQQTKSSHRTRFGFEPRLYLDKLTGIGAATSLTAKPATATVLEVLAEAGNQPKYVGSTGASRSSFSDWKAQFIANTANVFQADAELLNAQQQIADRQERGDY